MKTGALVKRTLWVALSVLSASSPAIAQSVGAIGGTIQDSSGGVIPGATVTLFNPGTIGSNQETVSDARGAYLFGNLVPSSTYRVQATLVGFRPLVRDAVAVIASQVTRLDLKLEVGELSEALTVTGQAPLLDTTSTNKQTVLDQRTLEVLPTGRDIWSIGRIVPALVVGKYDVGGSESLYASDVTLHGALKAEGSFLVDGVDVSNTASPGQSGLYPDTGMFDEINYQAGNAGAESDRGGVVISMVSKTGSNAFHGRFTSAVTSNSLVADNLTPKQRADLVASLPARLLAVNPNFSPTTKPKNIDNVGFSIGGPIAPDRLWFSASTQLAHVNKYWLGSYNTAGQQVLDDSDLHGWSTKISWQAKRSTQIHYLHTFGNRTNHHRTATALTTANDFYDERAMTTQFLPVPFDQARLTTLLSSKLALEVSGAVFRFRVSSPPADSSVGPGDIPRFDSVTNTYTVAYPTSSTTAFTGDPFNASVSYVAGGHNLKFGYQFKNVGTVTDTVTFSNYPAGFVAIYRNGVPDSVRVYNTPVRAVQQQLDNSLYLQDSWRASRKVTLNLGLRLQKSHGWVPAGCQAKTIFISEQCFGKIDNVPNWLDLAPRFGLVYDVFGDGKTALKLAANRYDIPVGSGFSSNVNPIKVATDIRSWSDLNNDGIPTLNEFGPSGGFNIGTTNRLSPDLKRPYVNELNVELQQELRGGLVVSAGYFYHAVQRQIASRNLAVPLASYTPIQVTEAVTGRQVTVYNQDPATRGQFDVLFANSADLNQYFNGFDLTFNKRISHRWMITGGLSLGKNVGDVYGTADLNNPNNTYRRGVVGTDVPVSVKASGLYELPYGISLSGNVSHYTGFPELDTLIVSRNTVVLTQVSQSIAVASRGTNRLDDVNFVDLSARKTLKIRRQLNIEPLIELFNVLNASPIQGRSTTLGPSYHRVAAVSGGRMLKFGLNMNF